MSFCAVLSPGLCPRGNSPRGRLHLTRCRECRASLLDGGYFCLKHGSVRTLDSFQGQSGNCPVPRALWLHSASHLSLPAPLHRAPDDASARCCLANLTNSTNANCLLLVWGKTKGALMEGQGLSVSQAGQHASGGLQPLPPAPRAAPLVGTVVFLASRPSPSGSSVRRGTLSSSTN